jgi:nitrite reductase/ring-hydroxylating ferredoxin subunit
MTIKSKIILFFIILCLPHFLVSCKKNKNDVIPTVYVYFSISLNDPLFLDLAAPFNHAFIDRNTNNMGQSAGGYDNNGIIVFNGADGFYAYDRTCPHDYEVNHKSIKVNIDGIFAVCPSCGTKYALTASGSPYSGVGQYPLKNYRTAFNGLYITVSNY